MKNRWIYRDPIPNDQLRNFLDVYPSIAQLLFNRGITKEQDIQAFLHPDYNLHIHDPFLFRDMKKAVERTLCAIVRCEKIVVHGDYDADGVCSAVLVHDAIKQLGGTIEAYLPHREKEGYGMNAETVKLFHKKGIQLIITTDCGMSNKAEISLAKSLGMDVIITDHHQEPLELPTDALAIINPNVSYETYPFRYLSGVGVAYKFICALFSSDHGKLALPGSEKWFLDLVAIGTVTDMMPLIDENRVLVKYGLLVLSKTKRIGIRTFLEHLKIPFEKIDTYHIGFQIGPRLNASGRLKHANLSFDLLVTPDSAQAQKLVLQLEQVNKDRKFMTDLITSEVKQQIHDTQKETDKVFFAYSKNWPVGLVGLVAGKIVQEYNRPAFILSETEGNIVASGRSIPQVNIVDVLQKTQDFYAKYGGHAAACGFTLKYKEDFDAWKLLVAKIISESLSGIDLDAVLLIDAHMPLKDIHWDFWKQLSQLMPFGQANDAPLFGSDGVKVCEVRSIGSKKQHLRLTVEQSGARHQAVGFGFGSYAKELSFGQKVNIAYDIDVNEWNGQKNLQLKIRDIQL